MSSASPSNKVTYKTWSYRQLNDANALCGPTIIAHPDTTLLIPVLNLMDRRDLEVHGFPIQDPVPLGQGDTLNTPHGFDSINLHTHGLNVSPSWPADDVFREVHPFQLKFYIYHLHADHPVGTFWYHPHKHGAVGPQVGCGMAGSLLVQGSDSQPLGLDKVAIEKGWGKDECVLLQQLTAYQAKAATPPLLVPEPYVSRPDFFALRKLFNMDGVTQIPAFGGLADWMKKNLEVESEHVQPLIDGQVNPALAQRRTGETYRLRLIHAGIEDDWSFAIQPKGAPSDAPMTADKFSVEVIAWDGLTLETPYVLESNQPLILSPGNRAEVLVHFQAGTEGAYEIRDRMQGDVTLATFQVVTGTGDPMKPLTDTEVAAAHLFKTPPSAPDGAPTPFLVTFRDKSIDAAGDGTYTFSPGVFQINGSSFPGVPRRLVLDQAARIKLGVTTGPAHPIHIHVNPTLLDASAERKGRGLPTGRYWADTVLSPFTGYVGTMACDHWSGRAVVHCHILDHEDAGMMNTLLVRPSGIPVAPLPGVFDQTSLAANVLALMRPAWPQSQVGIGDPHGMVTVYIFLPRSATTWICNHCADSVQAIARLRQQSGAPPFRIVAVTGPNDQNLSDLAAALQLDPARDLLCVDPKLEVFQALALLDGVPVLDVGRGIYTFPSSFRADGTVIHDGDVMHGLFIADPKGFLVSCNRDFMAYDDTEQTFAEIRFALDVPAALNRYESGLAAAPQEQTLLERGRRNLQRQQIRYQLFEESARQQ